MSEEEKAAAEKAADEAAASLLAEEGWEKAPSKKGKVKAKKSGTSSAQSTKGNDAVETEPPSAVDVSEAAGADLSSARSAAADEGLRAAMETNDLETLAKALEEHCSIASEATLVEARSQRDRLNKKRKKESQRLRKAHAEAMVAQTTTDATAAASSPPSSATQPAASPPPAPAPPQPAASAVELNLNDLATATSNFGKAKLIGSGGYGRVFVADKLPSLPASAVPEKLRHLPYAVKRAKSGAHKLDDLQREVSVLRACSHLHVLPLLGYYLDDDSPCLVFPLMRGGSFWRSTLPKGGRSTASPSPWHILRDQAVTMA